jgi:hypothetical protein
VTFQSLLNIFQDEPCILIVLCTLRYGQVSRELVKMTDDGSAHLLVRGIPRPKVRWYPASNAWDASEGRRPEDLIFCHQEARPSPQVLEETVKLPVKFMISRDFPVGLLDVLHHIDDLTQDSVESDDRVVWSWRFGRRTGLLSGIHLVLASRAGAARSRLTAACSVFRSRATSARHLGLQADSTSFHRSASRLSPPSLSAETGQPSETRLLGERLPASIRSKWSGISARANAR